MASSFRFRRSAVSGVSLAALVTLPAAAQEAPPAAGPVAAAEEVAAETIIVTGSRLARDPNTVAPVPISALTAADLAAAGNNEVTATLRQVPALLSSSTVADSLERGPAGTVGQAVLDLRDLGSNRTLVLVDGRRHVSGVANSQAVDVSTIPPALIESVEVLTGGASAVYGADAVTGVVNYKLRQDFEGIELDGFSGISSKGDGRAFRLSGTVGKNFNEGRGNITFSAGYAEDAEVLMGDREFTRDNGRGNNSTTYANPALRFQKGDIDPSSMPNFASFYRVGGPGPRGTRISFGPPIPLPGTALYTQVFGTGTPTAAEQALIDRARNAPTRVIGPRPTFAISANNGLLFRADYDFWKADINGNNINDCNESYIGWTGFGGGGCYVTNPDGSVRIFNDGIISTAQNQFGGDGAVERSSNVSLTPQSKRLFAVSTGRYEFSDAFRFFYDAKFARNTARQRNDYNTFYDSLFLSPENPFIPAVLRPDVEESGGLLVSRDFLDLGPGITEYERQTLRFVGGLRGEIAPSLRYEVSGVWGQTKTEDTYSNSVQYDRLFAALDVVTGPDGRPVCRSELDPTAVPPGSDVFPVIQSGFFTFRPGQGQCQPANILRGTYSVSPEAVAFITTPTTNRSKIRQSVITGFLEGDTERFFSLPGGPVQFAVGGEYRKEFSENILSDLEKGLLPEGSPAGPAGTFIGDISDNQSLLFDAQNRTFDSGGSFDVTEVFGEFRVPILADGRFAHQLSVEGAVRYADYSTVGGALTWSANGIWAPIPDVRMRGGYGQSIRAPDIFELFSPQQGATFRPLDPCNASEIASLKADNAPNAAAREANCLAAVAATGIANPAAFLATYEDPLTARFGGTTGGNPDLQEETATTWTAGMVVEPRWIPGLVLSADYYSIRIENAIAAVQSQDIVNTCYDLDTFPNQFCDLFERQTDNPASPTFFGFRSLTQTQVNFGRIEAAGVDFSANYQTRWRDNDIAIGFQGNWTQKVNRFFDPVNRNLVNPGLYETGAPRWSGLTTATIGRGPFDLNYRMQWIGRQAIASAIQIERLEAEFGDAGLAPHYFIHDISIGFQLNKDMRLTAGVNNMLDKEPYLASSAYPVSGVGRFVFVGMNARF
jgi:outer membrane receptor protein involved in Fe transport